VTFGLQLGRGVVSLVIGAEGADGEVVRLGGAELDAVDDPHDGHLGS
jgi:hypothetical protein